MFSLFILIIFAVALFMGLIALGAFCIRLIRGDKKIDNVKTLSKSQIEELSDLLDKLCRSIGLRKVKLYMSRDKRTINGRSWKISCNKVSLTNKLLSQYSTYPDMVRFYLAHELIHLKYSDSSTNFLRKRRNPIFNPRLVFFRKKYKAFSILQEMRADIEGYNLLKSETGRDLDLDRIRNITQEINKDDQETIYNHSYPKNEQRVFWPKRVSYLSDTIIEIILGDFCEKCKVKNCDRLINEAKSIFLNEMEGKLNAYLHS